MRNSLSVFAFASLVSAGFASTSFSSANGMPPSAASLQNGTPAQSTFNVQAKSAPQAAPATMALYELSAFASEYVKSGWTDVQGWVVSGGDASFRNFGLGTQLPAEKTRGLIVGGNLTFENGSLLGPAWVGGDILNMHHAKVSGPFRVAGAVSAIDHSNSEAHTLDLDAALLRGWINRVQARIASDSMGWAALGLDVPFTQVAKGKSEIVVGGKNPVVIVNMAAAELAQVRRMTFEGTTGQTFILNVTGDAAVLANLDVVLKGVSLGSILVNFPKATSLNISHSSNAVYGYPFAILAPCADVSFFEGLITGSLFARKINSFKAPLVPGGQINRSNFKEPRVGGCTPELNC